MYRKDHGKKFIKSLTLGGRKHYKRALSKTLRQQDRLEQKPRCPYCWDDTCGGWCG